MTVSNILEGGDTMGERIGRIGRIRTDFLDSNARISSKNQKKIRSYPPDPPNPFSHRISTFQSAETAILLRFNLAKIIMVNGNH
jgi:hypothetical protein